MFYLTHFINFDDILNATKLMKTYKETLDHHFEALDQIIYRLAFHGLKLSVNKTEFAKSKVLFLGWIVSHDYILPDPRRMEKIRDAVFPLSQKELRSFLGLVNSIRRVIPFGVIKEIQVLTPLTSSKAQFLPTEKHKQAFEKIKTLLLKEPLFCNLIREDAPKYLWVDAASSSGCLGAVLAQRIEKKGNEPHLPEYLDLSDKVHRIIYDKNLPYEPCKLYTSYPINVLKIITLRTVPPRLPNLKRNFGFTAANQHDSLFWSVISLLVLYNCKVPSSVNELRHLAVTEVKKGILGIKLKDQSFNNHHNEYRTFLQEFENGQHYIDKDLIMAQALAKGLHRCFIFISSLAKDRGHELFKFNAESVKPPLIFGIHQVDDKIIFTPFFYNKNAEFKIDSLRKKVQIIAYLAKSVPEAFRSRSILDLEALAILTALHSLQKYISNTKCYLLTDSRVLYYLFCQRVGDSSTKIRRWVLKILSDYPQLTLHFIRTSSNLADYLTRQGLPEGDLEKLNIKNIEIKDFYNELPKQEFTLQEWVKFCADHPHYLTINNPTSNSVSISIERSINEVIKTSNISTPISKPTTFSMTGITNIEDLTTPLGILKDRLSRANIIRAQKKEFNSIYTQCLASENFEFEDAKNNKTYRLILDLLMIKDTDSFKIYIPPNLTGPLLSFTHLLGHQGLVKMIKNLESYYFEGKTVKIKNFISSCYACFMSHGSSKKTKLGNYPLPNFPFEEVSVDLAESLNTVGGLSHLLIVQCVLTDYILVYPLKTKSAQEVCRIFLYNVLQSFNVSRVHQDNGPCFRNIQWLKLMAVLNIQIVNSSANNPSSRGKAERAVGQVKTLLKKLLATASSNTFNWELLPFLVSKIMNHTVTPRTGFKPAEMIFGQENMSESFLDRDKMLPSHHLVQNNKQQIENLTKELREMSSQAKEKLINLRQESHDRINKSRTDKTFKTNDIVFVLDRYILPGNSRPLKLKFFPSPWVVVKPYFTTCLVKRLADGFTALYSMDDLKLYKGADPIFSTLPPEVNKVLLHDFKDLIDTDFKIILKHDPLDIPTALKLIDTVDPKFPDESDPFNPAPLQEVTDEFYNENGERNEPNDNIEPILENEPNNTDEPINNTDNTEPNSTAESDSEPIQVRKGRRKGKDRVAVTATRKSKRLNPDLEEGEDEEDDKIPKTKELSDLEPNTSEPKEKQENENEFENESMVPMYTPSHLEVIDEIEENNGEDE